MERAKFDYFKETINKSKEYWLKGIEDVDWELQHEWLKSFMEEIVLLLHDCEDDDDKEFLYKYIEFINQAMENVLDEVLGKFFDKVFEKVLEKILEN